MPGSLTSNLPTMALQNPFQEVQEKSTWPFSGPNFTPVEFAVRCVMEMDVCAAPYNSTSILKQTRRTAIANFVENVVRRWVCFEKERILPLDALLFVLPK